jgi:hypothetical protein
MKIMLMIIYYKVFLMVVKVHRRIIIIKNKLILNSKVYLILVVKLLKTVLKTKLMESHNPKNNITKIKYSYNKLNNKNKIN